MRIASVEPAREAELAEPLKLLEEFLRDGEPVPESFAQRLREGVGRGDLEVLAARAEGRVVGVAVLAYRLSNSAAGLFASIEDLYVEPAARRRGVGLALLEAVGERCAARGVSYVEAQVEDEGSVVVPGRLLDEEEPGVCVYSRSYILFEPEA